MNDNDTLLETQGPAYVEGFTRRERRRLGIKEAHWVWKGDAGHRYTAYRIRLEKWYLRTGIVRAECYIDEHILSNLTSDEVRMDTIAGECLLHLEGARLHVLSGGARD